MLNQGKVVEARLLELHGVEDDVGCKPILSPAGQKVEIQATSDDRKIVFSTGADDNGVRALVLMSLDSTTHLPGAN